MCTILSPFESSWSKIDLLRPCAIIALAFLLLVCLTGCAGSQSALMDDIRIAGDENVRFGPEPLIDAPWEPFPYSGTGGEETYDSNRWPLTAEPFFTSGTYSTLPSAEDRALVENSGFTGASPESFQDAPQTTDPDRWRFNFTPHLWLPSVSGDSTVRGVNSNIGMTISDVVDATNYALFETFTAIKGKWFVYHFGMFTNMEDDEREGNLKIDTTSDQVILDLALGYRVLEGSVNAEEGHEVKLSLYGGVRYQYLKSQIDIDSFFIHVDESHDWLEPLVGGHLKFDITKSFTWDAALLDLSGFGIGSASDLTVTFYSGIKYRLGETYALTLGYKMFNIDYARGSGSARYSQDLLYNGPVVGLSFSF